MSSVEGEHAVCTECGKHSELRLLRRFPHICADRLFPVPDPDSESQEDDLDPQFRIKHSLAESIALRSPGSMYEKQFGRKAITEPSRKE